MNIYIKNIIDNDINLKKYLRYNSYNYKYLNRDFSYINILKDKMKKEYKITVPDKINNISSKIDMINNFIDIIK